MADSPFEITTTGGKKKGASSKGIIIALIVTLFLAGGVLVGVLLVRQNQNIQEKAAVDTNSYKCPQGQQCPVQNDKTHLRSCDPAEVDAQGTDPSESVCDRVGRVEICGGRPFCCPKVGGNWTTDMTVCDTSANALLTGSATATATASSTASATASPTASATASSTSKSTSTATSTATSKATSTASATKPPVPDTGTGWATYGTAGLGVLVIIGALLLAL